MKKIVSTNPGDNYSVIGEVTVSSLDEIAQKVKKAHGAKKYGKTLGLRSVSNFFNLFVMNFQNEKKNWQPSS